MSGITGEMPSYELRLIEANELIENGHHRSAVESASGGIELLMKALFSEMIDELVKSDLNRSLFLKSRYDDRKTAAKPKGKLSFGEWISLYDQDDMFDELFAVFGYDIKFFNADVLRNINDLRNRCAHEDYQPTSVESELVCNNLALFLKETNRAPTGEKPRDSAVENLTREWRKTWDIRIGDWLETNPDSLEAELVFHLINQLMLIIGLIGNDRVPLEPKSKLIIAVNYVISSDDLIPEATEGVSGLIDDVAVLAFTLHWFENETDVDSDIWLEHWAGEDHALDTIENLTQLINENHDSLFDDKIWEAIHPIADHGPGTLWQFKKGESAPNTDDIKDIYHFISEVGDETNWYETWRERVHNWISNNGDSSIANLVVVVPDIFMLITRLVRDRRISKITKTRLLAATAYVASPFDLIPEGLVGVVGLTDDAGALALIGVWLTSIVQIDKDILREHWSGDGDPVEVIDDLHQKFKRHAEKIFGGKTGIWQNLQKRFGKKQENDKRGIWDEIRRKIHRHRS